MFLDFREAGTVGVKHFAAEAVADEFAFANGFDEAGGFEFLHVVGDGGGGDGAAVADLLAGESVACFGYAAEQIVAAWIGQRLGDEVEASVVETWGHCI
jgi:hypothetical protein